MRKEIKVPWKPRKLRLIKFYHLFVKINFSVRSIVYLVVNLIFISCSSTSAFLSFRLQNIFHLEQNNLTCLETIILFFKRNDRLVISMAISRKPKFLFFWKKKPIQMSGSVISNKVLTLKKKNIFKCSTCARHNVWNCWIR